MEGQPKVSVIIPVYNTEKYLRQCLDSVVNQTLKDIEIICVDDGSTDRSIDILREYAERDNRIIIIEQENSGAGVARNNALNVAKGEYLVFFDSDDYFAHNMLEECVRKLEDEQSDIVVCAAQRYDMRNHTMSDTPRSLKKEHCPAFSPFSAADMPKYIFNSFQHAPWNKMFRHQFIKNHNLRFQEIPRANDLMFMCLALVLAEKISIIECVFVTYRVGTGTSLQSTNDVTPCSFWDAYSELKRRLIEYGLYEKYEQSFLNAALNSTVYNFNSVKSDAAFLDIYAVIKNRIEPELKISEYAKEYFYGRRTYEEYISLTQNSHIEKMLEMVAAGTKSAIAYLIRAQRELDYLHDEVDRIHTSWAYRIGRFITFIPRKVRGGVRCYCEHGFAYTIQRVLAHFRLKKEP